MLVMHLCLASTLLVNCSFSDWGIGVGSRALRHGGSLTLTRLQIIPYKLVLLILASLDHIDALNRIIDIDRSIMVLITITALFGEAIPHQLCFLDGDLDQLARLVLNGVAFASDWLRIATT